MSGKLKENLNELCRLCATKVNGSKGTNIFKGAREINYKINMCLSIEVLETDNLPKIICAECDHKLELCFAFRKKSIQTQSLLLLSLMKKMLQKTGIISESNITNDQLDLNAEFYFEKILNNMTVESDEIAIVQSPNKSINSNNPNFNVKTEPPDENSNNDSDSDGSVNQNLSHLEKLLEKSPAHQIDIEDEQNISDDKESSFLKINSEDLSDDIYKKVCRECGKSYKTNSELVEHMRRHTEEQQKNNEKSQLINTEKNTSRLRQREKRNEENLSSTNSKIFVNNKKPRLISAVKSNNKPTTSFESFTLGTTDSNVINNNLDPMEMELDAEYLSINIEKHFMEGNFEEKLMQEKQSELSAKSPETIKIKIENEKDSKDNEKVIAKSPSYPQSDIFNNSNIRVKIEAFDENSNNSDSNDPAYEHLLKKRSSVNSKFPEVSEKSRRQYEKVYFAFKEWCCTKEVVEVSEDVLLNYFEEISRKVNCSSLWPMYSMLKSMLNINEKIDIRKFTKLQQFLKHKSLGYRAKKSKALTKEQIDKFINEAPDEVFLMTKIVFIMGVSGGCKREELTNITINDIEDKGSVLLVKVVDSEKCSQRNFIVTNNLYIDLYRKYLALRPVNATNSRFFYKYLKGRCVNQVVGINKIGEVPREIAKFLNLPDANLYTGHCFRRSSAILPSPSMPFRRKNRWANTYGLS